MESIKSGSIPESVGLSGPVSVRGSSFYEDMIREKLGEDA